MFMNTLTRKSHISTKLLPMPRNKLWSYTSKFYTALYIFWILKLSDAIFLLFCVKLELAETFCKKCEIKTQNKTKQNKTDFG